MNKARRLEIEKCAIGVRNECTVLDYGIKDIFEAAEKIGYRMVRYPAGAGTVLGSSLLKDTERIVFSNSSQILSREIFTVAHEIGHQRLHISEQGTTLIEDNDFTDRDESEAEANYFAACLLMPQDKVSEFVRCEMNNGVNGLNGLNIARIQTAFNCSYDMVLFRLKTLGKLNDGQFESLKAEKSENTTERLLSVIGGNVDLCKPSQAIRIPPDYIKWVIENYNNKLIPKKSLDVALGFIGLNSEDFIDANDIPGPESPEDLLEGLN